MTNRVGWFQPIPRRSRYSQNRPRMSSDRLLKKNRGYSYVTSPDRCRATERHRLRHLFDDPGVGRVLVDVQPPRPRVSKQVAVAEVDPEEIRVLLGRPLHCPRHEHMFANVPDGMDLRSPTAPG